MHGNRSPVAEDSPYLARRRRQGSGTSPTSRSVTEPRVVEIRYIMPMTSNQDNTNCRIL